MSTVASPQNTRRAVIAASAGNIVEWYDWSVYAVFAYVFSKQFFPSDDPAAALISTFAVFAIGFIARPVGSVTLGRITDRMGRKAALTTTVTIIAVASGLIGLAPTAASIGIWAAVWLVTMRLAQGLALGAETSAVGAFLAESSRTGKRGAAVSVYGATVGIGTMIGSGVAVILTFALTDEQMTEFGWRIPFLFGALLGLVAFFVRRNAVETLPEGHQPARRPIRTMFTVHRRLAFMTLILAGALALPFFVLVTGFPSIVELLGAEPDVAFTASFIGLALLSILTPTFGALSDRVGRRPVLAGGLIVLFLLCIPGVALLWDPSQAWRVYVVQILIVIPLSAINGTTFVSLIERYPVSLRGSGLGFTWALAIAIFGGTGPMIATALANRGITFLMTGYFLVLLGAAAVIALRMRETAFSPLRD